MANTADILQTEQGLDLFYLLKITGLNVYFFAVTDPTDSKYGGAAWNLDGIITNDGMMLPDDRLVQSLPDVIGGIAAAERITLTLTDFDAPGATGMHPFLGRLFSPGIAIANHTYYELASDIGSTVTTGGAVKLRISEAGTAPANADYSVGGETITMTGFGAPDGTGVCTGTIGLRNKYPCSSVYPPTPSHRIVKNEAQTGALGRNIIVTPSDTPFTMTGRTAAFYIGHMTAAGVPCAESEMMLRVLGKIKGYDAGRAGGQYAIEIESLMSELVGAKVAPGLGSAKILDDQIILPAWNHGAAVFYRSMELDFGKLDGNGYKFFNVVIDDVGVTESRYRRSDLMRKVNEQLSLSSDQVFNGISLGSKFVDGEERHYFSTYISNNFFGGSGLSNGNTIGIAANGWGLMVALGFERPDAATKFWAFEEDTEASTMVTGSKHYTLVATKAVPSVFIPDPIHGGDTTVKFAIRGMDGSSSQYFFTDQANGQAGVAYAQLGDGTIVELAAVSHDATGDYLTTGNRQIFQYKPDVRNPTPAEVLNPFYYVPRNADATVKQVVVSGSATQDVDPGIMMAQLLASYDYDSAIDQINYFSEGVGFNWNRVLDRDAFSSLSAVGANYPRLAVIDSETKVADVFGPLLKEYGVGIVWDPAAARVTMRTLRIPAAPGAHAVAFSEDNRSSVTDRTAPKSDQSNARSSWTLKWGWDLASQKFTGTTFTVPDIAVLSAGITEKGETIEDKTIAFASDLDPWEFLNTMIFSRSDIYRQEWVRCHRTLNRFGLTLSPGSYHQIIDNTITNPFTGLMGITAADAIYGLLMSVTGNPATGMCEVEFLMSKQGRSSLFRPWAPTGMVDYNAAGRGYDNATGIVTMARRYSSHPTNHDGYDFLVGDNVALMAWDASPTGLGYSVTSTITAIAVDGSTVTVAAGLGAIPAETEVILTLSDYATATTVRRDSVSYQGNTSTRIIESVSMALNHKWG